MCSYINGQQCYHSGKGILEELTKKFGVAITTHVLPSSNAPPSSSGLDIISPCRTVQGPHMQFSRTNIAGVGELQSSWIGQGGVYNLYNFIILNKIIQLYR